MRAQCAQQLPNQLARRLEPMKRLINRLRTGTPGMLDRPWRELSRPAPPAPLKRAKTAKRDSSGLPKPSRPPYPQAGQPSRRRAPLPSPRCPRRVVCTEVGDHLAVAVDGDALGDQLPRCRPPHIRRGCAQPSPRGGNRAHHPAARCARRSKSACACSPLACSRNSWAMLWALMPAAMQ